MKCFYHRSDLDGICSGAVVKYARPECELAGINHGEEFPWDQIIPGETVYMVDFSLPGHEMYDLNGSCNLVWIDHHKTAIERMEGVNFDGIQRVGIGACVLVWEYFFPKTYVPTFIQLLGEWDVWDHSDPRCKPFQYGMRTATRSPEDPIWGDLFRDPKGDNFYQILTSGRAVVKYEEQSNEMRVAAAAFETELEGLRCIACNQMMTNSTLFDSIWDENKYDAMISFGWRKNRWSVSLYSTRTDVSKIAVKFGGGGHKHACGFVCDELPFKLGG
jgi:oligoribonuclease NrnB/cAMP/cGMP phosphodiesterase (DHH superfamily)